MADPVAKELLDVLACPTDKAGVTYNKAKTALVCTKCKREYPIKDGIPVMLPQP